jgi:hypothetical protein
MVDAGARRAILPVSLLLLLFSFVYACVPKPIADLRITQVTRVPASSLPPSNDLRDTLIQRGEFLWKVSLAGDANWIREVRRLELNSYPIVVRCDDRDSGIFSLGPYAGRVPVTYGGKGFQDYQPTSSIEQYDVYLPETGRYRSQADFNAPMPSYDLGRQSLTLCIRLAAGAMYGAYDHSNEVRVVVGRQP